MKQFMAHIADYRKPVSGPEQSFFRSTAVYAADEVLQRIAELKSMHERKVVECETRYDKRISELEGLAKNYITESAGYRDSTILLDKGHSPALEELAIYLGITEEHQGNRLLIRTIKQR